MRSIKLGVGILLCFALNSPTTMKFLGQSVTEANDAIINYVRYLSRLNIKKIVAGWHTSTGLLEHMELVLAW